jgi:hypothetical protein
MTHRPTALLLFPAAAVGLAALLYALTRHRKSSAVIGEIRDSMKETLAETRALHRTLRHQRGAINDIHRYLVPVSKGSKNRAS